MITAADIQTIRNNDPGAVLPGIDTMTGNPYATSSLLDVTQDHPEVQGALLLFSIPKYRVRQSGRRRAQRHQFWRRDSDHQRQQCHDRGLHVHRHEQLLGHPPEHHH